MKYTRALLRSTHGPAMSKRHRRGSGEQARTDAHTSAAERRAASQLRPAGTVDNTLLLLPPSGASLWRTLRRVACDPRGFGRPWPERSCAKRAMAAPPSTLSGGVAGKNKNVRARLWRTPRRLHCVDANRRLRYPQARLPPEVNRVLYIRCACAPRCAPAGASRLTCGWLQEPAVQHHCGGDV